MTIESVATLIEKIDLGETSYVQFKAEITDLDKFEAELVAFANTEGGSLLIGVSNDGQIVGLTDAQIEYHIQKNTDLCSQRINPPLVTFINTFRVEDKKILVIEVPESSAKPYFTKNGVAWGKVGADKRKLSREELKRLFQGSEDYFSDEQPQPKTSLEDVDLAYFSNYYFQLKKETLAQSGFETQVLLNRVGVMQGDALNLAGLLFFGLNPERYQPILHIKAVSFVGNELSGTLYKDSVNIEGKIEFQYQGCIDFCKRNLRYVQNGQGFNSVGRLEISQVALEEALINAFFHRDYTKSAPIRLLIFDNRVEIISPGALPNHLTVAQIQYGDTVVRNHRMVSFGNKILPYRGLGSGIMRILKEHPNTTFENDRERQQFKVTFGRP